MPVFLDWFKKSRGVPAVANENDVIDNGPPSKRMKDVDRDGLLSLIKKFRETRNFFFLQRISTRVSAVTEEISGIEKELIGCKDSDEVVELFDRLTLSCSKLSTMKRELSLGVEAKALAILEVHVPVDHKKCRNYIGTVTTKLTDSVSASYSSLKLVAKRTAELHNNKSDEVRIDLLLDDIAPDVIKVRDVIDNRSWLYMDDYTVKQQLIADMKETVIGITTSLVTVEKMCVKLMPNTDDNTSRKMRLERITEIITTTGTLSITIDQLAANVQCLVDNSDTIECLLKKCFDKMKTVKEAAHKGIENSSDTNVTTFFTAFGELQNIHESILTLLPDNSVRQMCRRICEVDTFVLRMKDYGTEMTTLLIAHSNRPIKEEVSELGLAANLEADCKGLHDLCDGFDEFVDLKKEDLNLSDYETTLSTKISALENAQQSLLSTIRTIVHRGCVLNVAIWDGVHDVLMESWNADSRYNRLMRIVCLELSLKNEHPSIANTVTSIRSKCFAISDANLMVKKEEACKIVVDEKWYHCIDGGEEDRITRLLTSFVGDRESVPIFMVIGMGVRKFHFRAHSELFSVLDLLAPGFKDNEITRSCIEGIEDVEIRDALLPYISNQDAVDKQSFYRCFVRAVVPWRTV